MKNKLLISLAAISFLFALNGCTSKDSKSEGETDIVSDSNVEKVEGQQEAVVIEDSSANKPAEGLPADALGTSTGTVENVADAPHQGVNLDSPPPVVDATQPSTGITETPISTTDSVPAATEAAVEKPKATLSPLQKVSSTPWMVGKSWVNAVYVARPGDTLKSISKMVYGEDRSGDLKKINTKYKSRSVKPGDKIYYNSPVRPEDSSKIANYYEDSGVPAETYVAKKGDNIRKVSKQLLGYSNAWMEVWSTNSVESKSKLSEGEILRYWKGAPPSAVEAAPKLAQNSSKHKKGKHSDAAMNLPPPPPPPMDQTASLPPPPPPPPDQNMAAGTGSGSAQGLPPPPPPPPDQGMAGMQPPPPPQPVELPPPPPPPPDAAAAHGNAMETLPPPPVDPPAPPKKVAKESNAEETEVQGQLGTTELGILGLAAVLAGGLAYVIIQKKRRQKAAAAMMSDSQVGT